MAAPAETRERVLTAAAALFAERGFHGTTMRDIAQQVKQTTGEQAKGSRHITRAIEEMTEMIREINRATADHGEGGRQIEAAVERMKATTQRHLEAAGDLNTVVASLGREARALRDEVSRFQL